MVSKSLPAQTIPRNPRAAVSPRFVEDPDSSSNIASTAVPRRVSGVNGPAQPTPAPDTPYPDPDDFARVGFEAVGATGNIEFAFGTLVFSFLLNRLAIDLDHA